MHFKALTASAATLAGLAAAAPAPQSSSAPITSGSTFGLVAIHSTHPIHNSGIVATQSGLRIQAPQDAVCHCDKTSDFATFVIENPGDEGELFLFNTTAASTQQLYTDRSGMGQGVLQYTRDAQQAAALNPNRIETKGWAVTADPHLVFKGVDFIACPSWNGSWAVWVNAGVANPGFQENCTGFAARVIETDEPVGCLYSNYAS